MYFHLTSNNLFLTFFLKPESSQFQKLLGKWSKRNKLFRGSIFYLPPCRNSYQNFLSKTNDQNFYLLNFVFRSQFRLWKKLESCLHSEYFSDSKDDFEIQYPAFLHGQNVSYLVFAHELYVLPSKKVLWYLFLKMI